MNFGATHRKCGDRDLFIDMKPLKNPRDMECANGSDEKMEFVDTIENIFLLTRTNRWHE